MSLNFPFYLCLKSSGVALLDLSTFGVSICPLGSLGSACTPLTGKENKHCNRFISSCLGKKAKTSRAGSTPGQQPAHLLYLQLSHKLQAMHPPHPGGRRCTSLTVLLCRIPIYLKAEDFYQVNGLSPKLYLVEVEMNNAHKAKVPFGLQDLKTNPKSFPV